MVSDSNVGPEIAAAEVEILVAQSDPEVQLVDVREEWELARGILPNATHIPLSQFEAHQDQWTPALKYIIYCEHGVRSLDVVMWLAQQKGIQARSMRGGFAEWQGPTESFGSEKS